MHVQAKGTVQRQSQISVAGSALKAQSAANGRSLAFAERPLSGNPVSVSVDLDLRVGGQAPSTAR
jgi:hypothetical protein